MTADARSDYRVQQAKSHVLVSLLLLVLLWAVSTAVNLGKYREKDFVSSNAPLHASEGDTSLSEKRQSRLVS
jgi:hypothetical protein